MMRRGVLRLEVLEALYLAIRRDYYGIAGGRAGFRGVRDERSGEQELKDLCQFVLYRYPGSDDASNFNDRRRGMFHRAAFLAYSLIYRGVFRSGDFSTNLRAAIDAGWYLVYAEGGTRLDGCASATDTLIESLVAQDEMDPGRAFPLGSELEQYYAEWGVCDSHNAAVNTNGPGQRRKRCHLTEDRPQPDNNACIPEPSC